MVPHCSAASRLLPLGAFALVAAFSSACFGWGGLRADRLSAAQVQVDGSGGCALQVRASESVRGDLSGGCALDVQGPAKVKVATSGGSSVGRDED